MRASDFDYALPEEQIAQQPATARDEARLYLLPRLEGAGGHHRIRELPRLLPEGALLVVNDSRVIPARLRGRRPSGGRVELLLLRRHERQERGGEWVERWRCLGRASKGLRPTQPILVDGIAPPSALVEAVHGAEVDVRFRGDEPGGMLAALERLGEVPLPPYIRRLGPPGPADRERYQTVYAAAPGSAAAPTAGLHFTPALLDALRDHGIELTAVTLHVGLGTFAPLRQDDLTGLDELHGEPFEIPAAAAAAITRARREGRSILAVGTTTVRALESAARAGELQPGPGETRLFIRPGHRFQIVDALLTNFHLPRSTLLMLVAAFVGRERILTAYQDAVARGYRFFSFGDAMLIR